MVAANVPVPLDQIGAFCRKWKAHVLARDYGEIKQERIWRVATIYVPQLIAQLEPLIPQTPTS